MDGCTGILAVTGSGRGAQRRVTVRRATLPAAGVLASLSLVISERISSGSRIGMHAVTTRAECGEGFAMGGEVGVVSSGVVKREVVLAHARTTLAVLMLDSQSCCWAICTNSYELGVRKPSEGETSDRLSAGHIMMQARSRFYWLVVRHVRCKTGMEERRLNRMRRDAGTRCRPLGGSRVRQPEIGSRWTIMQPLP